MTVVGRPANRSMGAIAAATLLGCLLISQTATGDPRKPQTPAESAAEQLFDEGNHLFDARDFAGAVDRFSRAYAERPAPRYLWNLALSELAAGRFTDALKRFSQYKDQSTPDTPHLDTVDKLIARCRAHVIHLVVQSPLYLATYVDDVGLGLGGTEAIDVDADRDHVVHAEGPGVHLEQHVPRQGPGVVKVQLVAPPGVALPDDPSAPPAAPAKAPQAARAAAAPPASADSPSVARDLTVIGIGTAVGVLLAGGLLYRFVALPGDDDNVQTWKEIVGNGSCPAANGCAGLADAVHERNASLDISTGLLVGAGSLAAVDAILFFAWPRSHAPAPAGWIRPTFTRSGAGVVLSGSF